MLFSSELKTETALMLKALADNESFILILATGSNSLSVDRSVRYCW